MSIGMSDTLQQVFIKRDVDIYALASEQANNQSMVIQKVPPTSYFRELMEKVRDAGPSRFIVRDVKEIPEVQRTWAMRTLTGDLEYNLAADPVFGPMAMEHLIDSLYRRLFHVGPSRPDRTCKETDFVTRVYLPEEYIQSGYELETGSLYIKVFYLPLFDDDAAAVAYLETRG